MSDIGIVGMFDGVARRVGSDARSFQTETASAEARFDVFNTHGDGDTDAGPYEPGRRHALAENLCVNVGGATDNMNIVWAELQSDGSVKRTMCSVTASGVAPGETYTLSYVPGTRSGCNLITTPTSPQQVYAQVSPTPGTTEYWGLKTWADSESEPSFPAPTSVAPDLEPMDVFLGMTEEELLQNIAVATVTGTVTGFTVPFFQEMLEDAGEAAADTATDVV